jgi:hypothetical protein
VQASLLEVTTREEAAATKIRVLERELELSLAHRAAEVAAAAAESQGQRTSTDSVLSNTM